MPELHFTFGILREVYGHPQVQGFFDIDPHVFEAAERSDGFIARAGYEDDPGPPTWGETVYPRFFTGDARDGTPATLSLWVDLESVAAFAYNGLHAEALSQGRAWFRSPEWPTHAAWWVSDDHLPDWLEAKMCHEHLHDNGPSPYAFNLQHPFDAEGKRVGLDHERIRSKANRNASRLL